MKMKLLGFTTFLLTQRALLAESPLQHYRHNFYGNLQFRLLESLHAPLSLKSLLWGGVAGSSEGLEAMAKFGSNKIAVGVLHRIGSKPGAAYGFLALSPLRRLQIVAMVPKTLSVLGTYVRFEALSFRPYDIKCAFALQLGSVFNLPICSPSWKSLKEEVQQMGFFTGQLKLGWLTISFPFQKVQVLNFQVGLAAPESDGVNLFEARKSLNHVFYFREEWNISKFSFQEVKQPGGEIDDEGERCREWAAGSNSDVRF